MWRSIQKYIWQWRLFLITVPSVATVVILVNFTGILQLLEWATLDHFFRWRPIEPIDTRLIVVTIDESDIQKLGHWPISDAVLAQLLTKIKQEQPAFIGLNIYRDLPIPPGSEELARIFETTPNLIGIEKTVGSAIAPSPILKRKDQIGFTDLVLDPDNKIRRALMSIRQDNGDIELSLATKLAFLYLEQQGIRLQAVTSPRWKWSKTPKMQLGKTILTPFFPNDGGYVRTDNGGYQMLLNFRGVQSNFLTISLTDVLENQIPPQLLDSESGLAFSGRIVLIGVTAVSINELFYSPYSNSILGTPKPTPGVIIHANILSQLLSSALDDRPLLRVWSEFWENLWILLWSGLGVFSYSQWLFNYRWGKSWRFSRLIGSFSLLPLSAILIGSSYLAFLYGLWLPVISPLLALILSAIAIIGYHNHYLHHLASLDSLTQIANRSYFQQYLEQEWWRCQRENAHLSIIMCDLDFFKAYNDNYGHQEGDRCLQRVVNVMRGSVRSADLVARYGGEEFIIILPNTNAESAVTVAQRICNQVRSLKIRHQGSEIAGYVTLSCGVASIIPDSILSIQDFIDLADQALYDAKNQGRDRVILKSV